MITMSTVTTMINTIGTAAAAVMIVPVEDVSSASLPVHTKLHYSNTYPNGISLYVMCDALRMRHYD